MTEPDLQMWERIDALPRQILESRDFLRTANLEALPRVSRVLLCGMGGSAAAGALLAGVYEGDCEVRVSRRYDPPSHWTRDALVIFASYSGNTAETLSAYDRLASGHPACIAVASGGALLERAQRDGVPWIRVPGGWPPRSTLGWGVGVLVRVLGAVGLVSNVEGDLGEAVARLESGRAGARARLTELASRLDSRLPFLYASDGLTEAVALRWRAQFNENAKLLCAHGLLPELNHNEVVGWELATEARSQIVVVALRDTDEPDAVARRFDLTRQVLGSRVSDWQELRAAAGGRLARSMELVQCGDYLSVLLAERQGIDPTPVEVIDQLKDLLRQ